MAKQLDIPQSSSTVTISIINSTSWVSNVPYNMSIEPVYPGYDTLQGPTYVFLIHHEPTNTRLLFDLGLRKNFKTHLNPVLLEAFAKLTMEMSVEKDVSEILTEHGVQPGDIDAIIYSHHHFDHVGDTTKFPGTTKLLVGPGYKKKYLPGYPVDPKSAETTSDLYEGRETVEVDFTEKVLNMGDFEAYDYFGDGSFHLLNTPGHTVGHLSALARTTTASDGDSGGESTFMFLGGDIVHHAAVFRPTEKYPLPKEISPAPDSKPFTATACPGELFAAMHRLRSEENGEHKSRTTPFCLLAGPEDDLAQSRRNVDKLTEFDGEDNILTVFAHDDSLLDVLEFFPATANEWKKKGWGKQGHWRFLAPLIKAQ